MSSVSGVHQPSAASIQNQPRHQQAGAVKSVVPWKPQIPLLEHLRALANVKAALALQDVARDIKWKECMDAFSNLRQFTGGHPSRTLVHAIGRVGLAHAHSLDKEKPPPGTSQQRATRRLLVGFARLLREFQKLQDTSNTNVEDLDVALSVCSWVILASRQYKWTFSKNFRLATTHFLKGVDPAVLNGNLAIHASIRYKVGKLCEDLVHATGRDANAVLSVLQIALSLGVRQIDSALLARFGSLLATKTLGTGNILSAKGLSPIGNIVKQVIGLQEFETASTAQMAVDIFIGWIMERGHLQHAQLKELAAVLVAAHESPRGSENFARCLAAALKSPGLGLTGKPARHRRKARTKTTRYLFLAAYQLRSYPLASLVYRVSAEFTSFRDLARLFHFVAQQEGCLVTAPFEFLLLGAINPSHDQQDPAFPLKLWSTYYADLAGRGLEITPDLMVAFCRYIGSLAAPRALDQFLNTYDFPLSNEQANAFAIGAISTRRVIPTLRIMRAIYARDSVNFSLHQVYYPLLDLVSQMHTRRIRLIGNLINSTPDSPTPLTYLFLMRAYTRRWNLSVQDLATARQLKVKMVEDGLAPDSRHHAEIIYGLTRRNCLPEAATIFLSMADTVAAGTGIVGLLVCRLVDAGMYGEAKRCLDRWRASFHSNFRPMAYVHTDPKAILIAEFYLAANQGGQSGFDWPTMEQLGLRRTDATDRLEKRLAARFLSKK